MESASDALRLVSPRFGPWVPRRDELVGVRVSLTLPRGLGGVGGCGFEGVSVLVGSPGEDIDLSSGDARLTPR
jgi:hypothetical protein